MYKVISCGIFQPYIEQLSLDPKKYDLTYLEIHQHNQPQKLSRMIQEEIHQSQNYEKIIILYGLCGGALLSLYTSKTPLIIIRVHDCMSILLGSKERYEQLSRVHKSLNWSCYSLKRENFVNDNLSKWEDLYDEETVEYLKSVLIQEDDFYISFHLEKEEKYVLQEKKIIEGDLGFLKRILNFESEDILYVYPHQKIKQTLDYNVIEVIDK